MVILLSLTNLKEFRLRLNLFFYYQQYIKEFFDIIRSIYELIRKENSKLVLFELTPARQKAFKTIKTKLAMTSVIAYLDFNKLFILYMDILSGGIRVVLY